MSDFIEVTNRELEMSVEYNYNTGEVMVTMVQEHNDPVTFYLDNLRKWDTFAAVIKRAHTCFHENLDKPTWEDHDDSLGGTMDSDHPHRRMEDC